MSVELLARELIDSLPTCTVALEHGTCPNVATRAFGRGGHRYCDSHGDGAYGVVVPEYPRAVPLRRLITAVRLRQYSRDELPSPISPGSARSPTGPGDHADGSTEAVGAAAAASLLTALGYPPDAREDTRDTPVRLFRALYEMTSGEREDPSEHLARQFAPRGYDETVALAGIEFTSLCEHHVLPFTGTAGVAYLPQTGDGAMVVGLSKLARLVEGYARRLQTQERMTVEIADALDQRVPNRGIAVVVEAQHSCMGCRGVRKPNAVMRTVIVRGAYMDHTAARAEVLALLLKKG